MGNPKQNPRKRDNNNGGGIETDLHNAARSGDIHAVQSICTSNPLTVNSRDKHSRTPLHLAAWSGNTEVVNYLCKNKADVGAAAMDDMGAVHFAAQKGHLEVVRALLLAGASVKACNRKGLTPLHYAVQGSHMELVKYLVKKGASLTAKTKAGKTPLELASNDEIRSYFLKLENSLKEGNDKKEEETDPKPSSGDVNEKNEETDPKPSLEDKPLDSDGEAVTKHEHEEEEKEDHGVENVKRKGDDDNAGTEGNLSQPKKAKIALNHLLAADDETQEENL